MLVVQAAAAILLYIYTKRSTPPAHMNTGFMEYSRVDSYKLCVGSYIYYVDSYNLFFLYRFDSYKLFSDQLKRNIIPTLNFSKIIKVSFYFHCFQNRSYIISDISFFTSGAITHILPTKIRV